MPSLRSLSKSAFASLQIAFLTPSNVVSGGSPAYCPHPQLSCHNTTTVQNTCCFNSPGGQLLQTQFWDTDPATGPADHWTVHGLWPDHCDGTYDSYCDPTRQYKNITAILQAAGATELLAYMNVYWKDNQGNDESFWEHEWGKHGTCISTLDTNCYTNYTAQQEVVDYFTKAVDLFKHLDSYAFLADAGITPSTTKNYTSAAVLSALAAARGYNATISCTSSGQLDEIWYYFDVRGSVPTGQFVPSNPDGSKSSCPATLRYLPKNVTSSPTPISSTASDTASATKAPSSTATGKPFSGKGYLNVETDGKKNGCIISGGTWYTTGTCATFTSNNTVSAETFTLKSSQGFCDISHNILRCAASVTTPVVFTVVNGFLTYGDSTKFYAEDVPRGWKQAKVYTTERDMSLNISWESK